MDRDKVLIQASNPAFGPAEIGDGDPEDHRGDQDESAYPSASSRFDAAVCGSIDKVRDHQRIVMVRILFPSLHLFPAFFTFRNVFHNDNSILHYDYFIHS